MVAALEFLQAFEVDVQRIAQTYLLPANRVMGIYQPNGEKEGEE